MVSPLEGCLDVNKKAAGVTSRRSPVPREQAVLSSALLTAALLTTALLFLLAPLTFTFLSFAILLSALSGRGGFVRLIWILLCIHDAFFIVGFMFRSLALTDSTLLIKSPWRAIWTETHNRDGGWFSYQAKTYRACHQVNLVKTGCYLQLPFGSATQASDPIVSRFNVSELTGNKLLS